METCSKCGITSDEDPDMDFYGNVEGYKCICGLCIWKGDE